MSGAMGILQRSPVLWAVVENETVTARALVAGSPALHCDVQPDGDSEAIRMRSALGHALALHLLARTASCNWRIEKTKAGRPIAHGEVERHVSISHTGVLVVAAVSAIGPIGIDVERRDKVRDFTRLAEAAFGPAEAAMVAAEGADAFYRIWSVREAMSKATGEGLPTVVDRKDRVPPQFPDSKWIVGKDNWWLAHDIIKDRLSLALAIQAASPKAAKAITASNVADLRVRV